MMLIQQAKRKAAIVLTLLGFCLTSSTAMAIFLFVVGALNYLSLVIESMYQLPPLATPPKTIQSSTSSQPLHFAPGDNIPLFIQQHVENAQISQQSSLNVTNTPKPNLRVKI